MTKQMKKNAFLLEKQRFSNLKAVSFVKKALEFATVSVIALNVGAAAYASQNPEVLETNAKAPLYEKVMQEDGLLYPAAQYGVLAAVKNTNSEISAQAIVRSIDIYANGKGFVSQDKEYALVLANKAGLDGNAEAAKQAVKLINQGVTIENTDVTAYKRMLERTAAQAKKAPTPKI